MAGAGKQHQRPYFGGRDAVRWSTKLRILPTMTRLIVMRTLPSSTRDTRAAARNRAATSQSGRKRYLRKRTRSCNYAKSRLTNGVVLRRL